MCHHYYHFPKRRGFDGPASIGLKIMPATCWSKRKGSQRLTKLQRRYPNWSTRKRRMRIGSKRLKGPLKSPNRRLAVRGRSRIPHSLPENHLSSVRKMRKSWSDSSLWRWGSNQLWEIDTAIDATSLKIPKPKRPTQISANALGLQPGSEHPAG